MTMRGIPPIFAPAALPATDANGNAACWSQTMKRIILRGGRVIDPANQLDAVLDVAIAGERIEAVGQRLPAAGAEIIDCSDQLVLPGLIDTHAHVYEHVTGSFWSERRSVRRALRRYDPGGPGRAELHDVARLSAFRGRAGEDPGARLSVGLSGRRFGRALLPHPCIVRIASTCRRPRRPRVTT